MGGIKRTGSSNGVNGVLEGAVVQLHRVLVARRPTPFKPAGEVDVDHVEPPRAEAQVHGLDVDDDLVALAHLA